MTALALSKRAFVAGGVAMVALPAAQGAAMPPTHDLIGAHLEGFEVLGHDRRPLRVGELLAGTSLDPEVRRFLIAQLNKAKNNER